MRLIKKILYFKKYFNLRNFRNKYKYYYLDLFGDLSEPFTICQEDFRKNINKKKIHFIGYNNLCDILHNIESPNH